VSMPHHRFAVALGFAGALLLALASASVEATAPAGLVFSTMPARALAGQTVTVAVTRARSNALCSLSVRYADGALQQALRPLTAVGGRASWSWTIPESAQPDLAKLTVACGSSHPISGKLLVVGSLIPPRMSVDKDGFSVRARSYGGAEVSYGVILRNRSPNADALNVDVLVNFVLADDHLLGSTTASIPLIAADSSYALGGTLGFPGAAPVVRLEVVIQVGSKARHSGHPPAVDNAVIEPSISDQGWVGDVAGELINNDAQLTLQNAQLSAVVFDAAGNVLGGGTGSSFGSLPPGTRILFKLSGGGFGDIPADKAASVMVSAVPTWQKPSTPAG
jgi:hypothetical protein